MNVGATLSAAGLSVLVFGFSNVSSAFGPLPLDLTAFGMPGCYARVARAVARVDPRRNACRPLGVADAEGTLAIGSLPRGQYEVRPADQAPPRDLPRLC